jgi:hypothetical protein
MVSFNNRFFYTKEAAKAFQKQNKRGKLITYSPRGKESFMAEMMVAAQRRGEVVFPEETPYCVAWNEVND